eukprot:Em0005g1340a
MGPDVSNIPHHFNSIPRDEVLECVGLWVRSVGVSAGFLTFCHPTLCRPYHNIILTLYFNVIPTLYLNVIPTLYPNVIPTLYLNVIPALYPNVIPTLYPNVIPALYLNVILTLYPNVILTLYPNVILTLYPNVIPALYPNVIPTLYPNVILTLYPNFIRTLGRHVALLKSNVEGHYPELIKATEERLHQLNPQSKLLWKDQKVQSLSDLPMDQQRELLGELEEFNKYSAAKCD